MSDLPTKFFSKESLLSGDRLGALIFMLTCLCYGYQTTLIPLFPGDEYEPFTARTLPTLLTFIGIGLSLILLVTGEPNKKVKCETTPLNWKLLIGFLVLMALYGVGLTYLGFVLATSFFLLAGFYLLGERRKSILFGASFPFVIAFFLLLTQGLDIYLEPGLIFTLW
ncbi:MAG: tripartite tricarboxylate transporter TctB family protein [Vibrio toranzoniae]|uniref:tripartite tricarboxylate transporter TctB family protein n=1 Tax=Vibrio toranzoniae TaxID=1194427 RepID=UPI001378D53F|nr:tripartite tricarboxylate transporter TctB family protein [Vibrio toranzoniae]NAZ54920.1 tripartite tricarboxylate transporter TctB family protein [Vibrio toranzoniae]NAZ95345.1 tripartite tricarboxylate transporter TctB family protein [Vibrio toranzoniae]